MSPQDILFYFAFFHQGDWNKIYESIRNKERVDEEKLAHFKEINHYSYITLLDKDYPEGLKQVYMPPYVLFYEGDLNLLKSEKRIAVIGTRKMTDYGEEMTEFFVNGLVKKDYVIVSGLAKGIDGKAHRVCLEKEGKTIGVVANGLDICYPLSNQKLYQEIASKGLIISEYPQGVEAEPISFHFRNRIVAAISNSVLVIEAYAHSGTLITVRFALEMGRDVYCLPDQVGKGSICNKLIKDMAYLVDSIDDIA